MLFDSLGHFVVPPPVTEAFVRLGFPVNRSHMLAIILLVCVILYVIPRTAALGAVLLTGYLGGAVAIQLRAGSPTFEMLFPVLLGIVAWAGPWLRCAELRAFIPIRN